MIRSLKGTQEPYPLDLGATNVESVSAEKTQSCDTAHDPRSISCHARMGLHNHHGDFVRMLSLHHLNQNSVMTSKRPSLLLRNFSNKTAHDKNGDKENS